MYLSIPHPTAVRRRPVKGIAIEVHEREHDRFEWTQRSREAQIRMVAEPHRNVRSGSAKSVPPESRCNVVREQLRCPLERTGEPSVGGRLFEPLDRGERFFRENRAEQTRLDPEGGAQFRSKSLPVMLLEQAPARHLNRCGRHHKITRRRSPFRSDASAGAAERGWARRRAAARRTRATTFRPLRATPAARSRARRAAARRRVAR